MRDVAAPEYVTYGWNELPPPYSIAISYVVADGTAENVSVTLVVASVVPSGASEPGTPAGGGFGFGGGGGFGLELGRGPEYVP